MKGKIAALILVIVVLVVFGVGYFVYKDSVQEVAQTDDTQSSSVEVNESVIQEAESEVDMGVDNMSVLDENMQYQLQEMYSTILNDKKYRGTIGPENIRVEIASDGRTRLFLQGLSEIGYQSDTAMIAEVTPDGEFNQYDEFLEVDNFMYQKYQEKLDSEAPTEFHGSEEVLDIEGYEKADTSMYMYEGYGRLPETDIRRQYGDDFYDKVVEVFGNELAITDLTNFIGIEIPYLGEKYIVEYESETVDNFVVHITGTVLGKQETVIVVIHNDTTDFYVPVES